MKHNKSLSQKQRWSHKLRQSHKGGQPKNWRQSQIWRWNCTSLICLAVCHRNSLPWIRLASPTLEQQRRFEQPITVEHKWAAICIHGQCLHFCAYSHVCRWIPNLGTWISVRKQTWNVEISGLWMIIFSSFGVNPYKM